MNKAVKVIIIIVSSIVSLAVILMIVFAILLNNFFSKLQEDKVSLTSPIVQLFISDDKKVELICKKTISTIKTEDTKKITELFSKKLIENENIEEMVNYLKNIAKENILNYTCRLNGVSDHFDSGNQRKTYRFSCNVVTEMQEYVMSFEYDYKNEFDNSTLGINSLSIFVNREEKIKVDME